MLSEFYESSSLMRSDEANMILALLTSLNVVDCNLCVKVRPFPQNTLIKAILCQQRPNKRITFYDERKEKRDR